MRSPTIQDIGMRSEGAVLSDDGKYRYLLWRRAKGPEPSLFPERERTVCFLMLNPSTADARTDDPTVRRCKGFAFDWDYPRLFIVNLFAFRAANPADLKRHLNSFNDIGGMREGITVHYENDEWVEFAFRHSHLIILAWGANLLFECQCRAERIEEITWEVGCKDRIKCLGRTKHLAPRHPLMLPKNTKPIDWEDFD